MMYEKQEMKGKIMKCMENMSVLQASGKEIGGLWKTGNYGMTRFIYSSKALLGYSAYQETRASDFVRSDM